MNRVGPGAPTNPAEGNGYDMLVNSVANTAMEKALSALWQRQQTISHNIANEDTPDYKAKRTDFESALKRELSAAKLGNLTKRETIGRLNSLVPVEYELGGLAGRVDGNNVDLDSEYVEMARTAYHYNALQQRISSYYTSLKYVIGGGR